jgi:hypothetical protein
MGVGDSDDEDRIAIKNIRDVARKNRAVYATVVAGLLSPKGVVPAEWPRRPA